MVIWIKSIRRKLFYVSLGQSSEFSLSQALSEVQQSLIIFHFTIIDIQF